MFNVNSTNSSEFARSVQRDYEQAAANRRLLKESGSIMHRFALAKIGAVVTSLVAVVAVVSQLI